MGLWCPYAVLILSAYFVQREFLAEAASDKKPHILFVLADDLGFYDVPWHNPTVVAPTLKELASKGVILDQSYVEPTCSPTRSAILSGRYPFEIGRQYSPLGPLSPTGLNLSLPLIPNYLKELGYSTHAIGKWHLGFCNWAYTPTERGFDTFRGFYLASGDYYEHTLKRGDEETEVGEDSIPFGYDFRNNRDVDIAALGNYSTFQFASAAEEVLESSPPSVPKFIYLSFQSVHTPLQVPEEYLQPYTGIDDTDRQDLLAMVTAMDDAMARVVAKLKETGHYDNTVIIFTSDNGGSTRAGSNNWPLRGGKGTIWEGGTRAAGFVHSPLLTNGGTTSKALIHATDWLSTIVSMAGGPVPKDTSGYNQWDVLQGKKQHSGREEVVYTIYDEETYIAAIRNRQYKLILGTPRPGTWTTPPEFESSNATTTEVQSRKFNRRERDKRNSNRRGSGRRRFNRRDKRQAWWSTSTADDFFTEYGLDAQLYDLKNDPSEEDGWFSDFPSVAEELARQLLSHEENYVSPDDPPIDQAGNPGNFGGVWSPGWC